MARDDTTWNGNDHRLFDPEYARRKGEFFLKWARRYLRYTVRGWEHVPDGPVLVVGNHNGGAFPVDPYLIMFAWNEHFAYRRPLRGFAHDLLFRIRPFARFMCKVGAVRANPETARQILEEGGSGLVFPGGSEEAFRPFRLRYRVDFFQRTGFARLAVRTGAAVIPAAFAGGHETFVVLSDGRGVARRLGTHRYLRVSTFPLVFSLPWGITSGYLPYFPLPAKVHVQLGAPLVFKEYGPEDARDPVAMRRCADVIFARVQQLLTAQAASRRFPVIG